VSSEPDFATLDSLRRELALRVNRDGLVTWADPTATALLGVSVGRPLNASVLTDRPFRIDDLLNGASAGLVHDWPVRIKVHGEERLLSCSAVSSPEGVSIVGLLVPPESQLLRPTFGRT
jgi:hypothetical protein